MDRFTPSQLISYQTCPLAYYYTYVAGIKLPQPQIHLLFGSAIHAAIDSMYNNGNLIETFKNHFDKNKLLESEKNLYDEYLLLGLEMIKNYLNEHKTLSKLYNLDDGESELYVRKLLRNPLTDKISTLPMSGRIDRLTSDGIIIDYKTSKNKWNSNDVSSKMQTLLYNLWYYSEYQKVPKNTLYIVLLKKYKKEGKGETIQVISNHATLDELASAFDEVEIILQKIKNREFERPIGYHPAYCSCYLYEERLNFQNRK